MKKTEVIDAIKQQHQILYKWLENHPDQDWVKGPQNKWNTGEHIVHLIQSESALIKALWIPKFYLKYKFGANNRDNRTYEQVVQKYQGKLADNPGVVATISRNMPAITIDNKTSYIQKLQQAELKLIKKLERWNESDLDTYLLPHPLIGRMTIREIMMWTAYHTEHHYNILKSDY